MEVPVQSFQSNGLATSVRECRFGITRERTARVLGFESVLQRLEQSGQDILHAVIIKLLAVSRVSLAVVQLGEGFELVGHLEWRATELTQSLYTLAEGREDIGRLRYGKGKIADVDEGGKVDGDELDVARREDRPKSSLDGQLL